MFPDSIMTDTLVAVSDSTQIFNYITQLLPGISPAFVMLAAGWLSTRVIWAIKLVTKIYKLLPPAVQAIITTKVKDTWHSFSWIINPALMIAAGFIVSGKWDVGVLIGFAGIGVREWLIKSPIPTSIKELQKLKGKIAGLALLPLLLCSSNVDAADRTSFTLNELKAAETMAASILGISPNAVRVDIRSDIKPRYSFWEHTSLSAGANYNWETIGMTKNRYPALYGSFRYLWNGRFSTPVTLVREFSVEPHSIVSTGLTVLIY